MRVADGSVVGNRAVFEFETDATAPLARAVAALAAKGNGFSTVA
jgi:hypothetical protein